MNYRKATLQDKDELVKLRIEFVKEVQKVTEADKDNQLTLALQEYFQTSMTDGSFVSWLAIEDDKIVGTSGICFYYLPASYKNLTGKTAYIMNMYTLPEYRGRGIANTLFQNIVNEAKIRGCTKISLNATDMGRPIYTKYGFVDSHNDMVLSL